jgi:hypothetical protein
MLELPAVNLARDLPGSAALLHSSPTLAEQFTIRCSVPCGIWMAASRSGLTAIEAIGAILE